MRPSLACIFIALYAVAATTAVADTLHLADGSRIEGRVIAAGDTLVIIDTDFAGRLEIRRDRIVSIEASAGADPKPAAVPVHVAGSDLDPIGDAEADAGETGGATWTSSAELGFSAASGNTDRLNVNTKVSVARKTDSNRMTMNLRSRFAREDGQDTENEIIGRYNVEQDLSPRWFAFGNLVAERDDFEELDLRSILSVGTGYFVIDRDDHEFKPRLGVGYQREDFMDGTVDEIVILSSGYDYMIKLNSWLRITHNLTLFTSTSDISDDFRLESEAGFDLPVSQDKAWRLRLGIRNQFDATPQPGAEKLDSFFTISLGYDF